MKLKNKKYIIGIIIAAAFIWLAITSFDESKAEYTDFRTAMKNEKSVQVAGEWINTLPYHFNTESQNLTFYMKDTTDFESKVVYKGSMPSNFKLAPRIVVKGKFVDSVFMASSILTKCPSKYDSNDTIK